MEKKRLATTLIGGIFNDQMMSRARHEMIRGESDCKVTLDHLRIRLGSP